MPISSEDLKLITSSESLLPSRQRERQRVRMGTYFPEASAQSTPGPITVGRASAVDSRLLDDHLGSLTHSSLTVVGPPVVRLRSSHPLSRVKP